MNKHLPVLLLTLLPSMGWLYAQEDGRQVADKIAAIVGDEIVLQSEVMKNLSNLPGGDSLSLEKKKCLTLAKTLEKKLLLTKAKADSVAVKKSRINAELNRRIQYFVRQIGSREKLEKYYNRTIPEIRENFRQPVKELLRSQRMRQKLLKSVSVSPDEVKAYYQSLPPDSIPYFNTQVKLAHIVRKPKPTEKEKRKARQRLRELRKRIVEEGESFDNLAILYSDDQKTATNGGEIDMQKKSNFNKQFATAATKLEKGKVSRVVKTPDGFHLIKLLDRKGDQIHVKHILKQPQITAKSIQKSRAFLDSVRQLILNDTLSFEQAAVTFSEDDQTRNNGGLITNSKTGANKLPAKKLNSEMFFNVDTMQVGNISKPLRMKTKPGSSKEAFRIIKLKEKIPPHRANLKQDYTRLKRMALNKQKKDKMTQWYKNYARQTYLELKTDATDCKAIKPYLPTQ